MHGLVSRRVKLAKSGRNWKGCCPFHSEKSASFYVYEDGFHCFGCGAHGDAITFVMQTGGGAFIDAVEALAGEAGLEVPRQSARAAEIEQERLDLFGIMDLAQAEFVRLLHAPEGAAGLAYLRKRGLSAETIQRFGLGWSGAGRGSLVRTLAVEPALLEEVGLLRASEEGGAARELFWDRVTFPIRDRRGRVISFGGRTLGEAKPKYINGPETRLFLKRHTLYALDLAREGVRRGPLVVAEGYMDVIVLHQAGFAGAVAPLGTALTAEQLEAMWRLSPVPVLCFDGDAAGARAAARVAELCLPLVTAERSLRFATLPAGQDPDSLVRRDGPGAFQAVLDGARPLMETLFAVLREGAGDSPEARAAFRKRLDAAAERITERTLAQEYRTALRNLFFAARATRPGVKPVVARPTQRFSPTRDTTQNERGRCLTALLLRHPAVLRDTEEAYASLELPPPLERLRDAILLVEDHAALDSATLLAHLHATGLVDEAAYVLSTLMPLPPSARPDAMPAEVESDWWHIFGMMHGLGRLDEEVAAAERAHVLEQSATTQRRLIGLANARLELMAVDTDA